MEKLLLVGENGITSYISRWLALLIPSWNIICAPDFVGHGANEYDFVIAQVRSGYTIVNYQNQLVGMGVDRSRLAIITDTDSSSIDKASIHFSKEPRANSACKVYCRRRVNLRNYIRVQTELCTLNFFTPSC